jgi:hypothetical protein
MANSGFFGNEMSASLDLTAADVVGNVVPSGRDVAQKRLSGTVNLRVQLLVESCRDTARPLGRIFLSFPRAYLARERNPEFRWRTWGRAGILRAAATRENDRARDRARPELSL